MKHPRRPRHRALIATIVQARKAAALSQCQLAQRLGAVAWDLGMAASNQVVVLMLVAVESDPTAAGA